MASETTMISTKKGVLNDNQKCLYNTGLNNNIVNINDTDTIHKTANQVEETSLVCHICKGHYATKEKLKTHILTHSAIISQICDTLGFSTPVKDFTGTFNDIDRFSFTKGYVDEKANKDDYSTMMNDADLGTTCAQDKHVKKDSVKENISGDVTIEYESKNKSDCEFVGNEVVAKAKKAKCYKAQTCSICSKTFTRTNGLRKHMLIHYGEMPYSCLKCKRQFRQSAHLGKHVKYHCKIKNTVGIQTSSSVLNRGCHKTCIENKSGSDEVVEQELQGSKEEGIKHASDNNVSFTTQPTENTQDVNGKSKEIVAIEHTVGKKLFRNNSKMRRFECQVCRKKFQSFWHLKDHSLVHTGQKPYLCKICLFPFTKKSNLNRHMRRKHSNSLTVQVNDDELEDQAKVTYISVQRSNTPNNEIIKCNFMDIDELEVGYTVDKTYSPKAHTLASIGINSLTETKHLINGACDLLLKHDEFGPAVEPEKMLRQTTHNEDTRNDNVSSAVMNIIQNEIECKETDSSETNGPINVFNEQKCLKTVNKFADKDIQPLFVDQENGFSVFSIDLYDTHNDTVECAIDKTSNKDDRDLLSQNTMSLRDINCDAEQTSNHCAEIGNRRNGSTSKEELQKGPKGGKEKKMKHAKSNLVSDTKQLFENTQNVEMYTEEIIDTQEMVKFKSRSEKRKFECEVCRKKFQSSGHLKDHSLVHSGLKPHVCKICLMPFSLKRNMKRHIRRRHTNDNTRDLSDKTAVHQQEKRFDLKGKVDKMKTKNTFLCEVCGRSCRRAGHLAIHMRKHNGERPYRCDTCNRGFAKKFDLKRHVMTVHKRSKINKRSVDIQDIHSIVELLSLENEKQANTSVDSHSEQALFETQSADKETDTNSQHKEVNSVSAGRLDETKCDTSHTTNNDAIKMSSMPVFHEKKIKHERKDKADGSKTKDLCVCKVCGQSCNYVSHLAIHMRSHTSERPYKCVTCSKAFARKGDLKRHAMTVHKRAEANKASWDTNKHDIDSIVKQLSSEHDSELNPTADSQSKQPLLQADKSSENRNSNLQLHSPNVHKMGILESFESVRQTRTVHTESRKTERKCNFCSKMFSRKWTYDRHLMTHTGEKPDPCPICNKYFRGPDDLRIHMRIHENKRYACEICGMQIRTLSVLKKHLLKHSGGENDLICEFCGKQFQGNANLLNHKKTHVDRRDYKCDFCNKIFRQKNTLKSHTRSHLGIKMFACSVCNMRFGTRSHLKNHIETHATERSLKCEICGKSFRLKLAFQYHMFSHTGAKPFSCIRCDQKFKRADNLRTHMLIHEGMKPHRCAACGNTFRQKISLKLHTKRIHENHDRYLLDAL